MADVAGAKSAASQYQVLSAWQVGIAVSLILISGLISVVLQLGLERRLLVASLRTVVQLLLVGLVLQWIFAAAQWYFVVAMMLVMTLIAGMAAVQRTERRYRGIWLDSVVSMWASSWLVAAVALLAVVQVQPWYRPQYAIPLLGMILGNMLNGIALGMDRLGEELVGKRDQVETLLALGATRWEAAHAAIQQSVRTGMVPTINTMMVVGLVSLPGMMTGQLLAGVVAVQAVLYQIVIMFLIAAGTSLGTVSAVLLGYRRLFTADHQFLPARLEKRR
jgi:putative ABC transport system permease protein